MLSCSSIENNYVIEGTLTDKSYDGEYMYLVPIEGATAETVDSIGVTRTFGCYRARSN